MNYEKPEALEYQRDPTTRCDISDPYGPLTTACHGAIPAESWPIGIESSPDAFLKVLKGIHQVYQEMNQQM